MTINGQSAEANLTITLSEYGDPVTVEVPVAVSEAEDSEWAEPVPVGLAAMTASIAL